jgi:CHAT domain-containing protein
MPNVALLSYFASNKTTRVFLLRPDRSEPLAFDTQVTPQELGACLQRLLIDFHGIGDDNWPEGDSADSIRQALKLEPAVDAQKRKQRVMSQTLSNPACSYRMTYWDSLSGRLLPHDLRTEVADCDLLCISPHGPLHSLPLAALRWSKEGYLIERFGICDINSAGVLRYCQAKNRARTSRHRPASCMIAAVASAEDHEPSTLEGDGDWLAKLFRERNPHSKVTRLVGARPADGQKPASKDEIQKAIGEHDVVHFACHGVFGMRGTKGDPLDSGLLVSDGNSRPLTSDASCLDARQMAPHTLTAREVFSLRLTADLVTLRACSSGRAYIRSGDELMGLVRSFLYAGAPSLLLSLWDVNQESSQLLLEGFYRRWLNPEDPIPKWRALQLAQQCLLRIPKYQHPYHWAPFVLIGDWV